MRSYSSNRVTITSSGTIVFTSFFIVLHLYCSRCLVAFKVQYTRIFILELLHAYIVFTSVANVEFHIGGHIIISNFI